MAFLWPADLLPKLFASTLMIDHYHDTPKAYSLLLKR